MLDKSVRRLGSALAGALWLLLFDATVDAPRPMPVPRLPSGVFDNAVFRASSTSGLVVSDYI